jgi:calcineurin-like phosphoesterase family protein
MKKTKNIIRLKTKIEKKEHLNKLSNNPKTVAKVYKKETNYSLGDFIDHPKFGLGFILNIVNQTKIEVYFDESEKILLQNWV